MTSTNQPAKAFYNEELDLTVRFKGDEFVVIGDAAKVSDETVLELFCGRSQAGWKQLPKEHYVNS